MLSGDVANPELQCDPGADDWRMAIGKSVFVPLLGQRNGFMLSRSGVSGLAARAGCRDNAGINVGSCAEPDLRCFRK